MQDFSVEGVRQMFWGVRFLERRNDILLLGKALKFGVNFQEDALKSIKFEKLLRKLEKNTKFLERISIWGQSKIFSIWENDGI